jgi:alkanesulfonate monooxygenase SsuD/methylene tetrahydromethanopterin reductase-like flavin-dependent oxidoreductase (luciferase family)
MKFGIVYPTYSEYVNKKLVENVARKAEENDFEYFFVSDHYMTSDTSVWFESWSLLSYLSAITTKIKQEHASLQYPLGIQHNLRK